MLAEILGKATGTNRGKGGTLHLASAGAWLPDDLVAASGGPLPIAVGSAFAFQELGQDRVSVCLFGDGALEEGAWHEAANIAAMRGVPVIFLCENNSLEALGQRANEYPSSTLAAVELTDLVAPVRHARRGRRRDRRRRRRRARWPTRSSVPGAAAVRPSSRRGPSAGRATGRSGRSS